MKKYTSRDLQVKTKEILDSLPAEITRNGKTVAYIYAPEENFNNEFLEAITPPDPFGVDPEVVAENYDGEVVAQAKIDFCKFRFHPDKQTRKIFNIVKTDENDVILFAGWACKECIRSMNTGVGRIEAGHE